LNTSWNLERGTSSRQSRAAGRPARRPQRHWRVRTKGRCFDEHFQ
jgi:hypothetical protein